MRKCILGHSILFGVSRVIKKVGSWSKALFCRADRATSQPLMSLTKLSVYSQCLELLLRFSLHYFWRKRAEMSTRADRACQRLTPLNKLCGPLCGQKDVNDIPRRVCCVHQSRQSEQTVMSPSVKPHTERVISARALFLPPPDVSETSQGAQSKCLTVPGAVPGLWCITQHFSKSHDVSQRAHSKGLRVGRHVDVIKSSQNKILSFFLKTDWLRRVICQVSVSNYDRGLRS